MTPGPSEQHPWRVTDGALDYADLPESMNGRLAELRGQQDQRADGGIVAALASEIIRRQRGILPRWAGTGTFYLVFDDVPTPALMRLPTILRVHKPDRRLHVTADRLALRRLLVARSRRVPEEGIVDAYVVGHELVLVLGDLTVRSFPREQIPEAGELSPDAFSAFELDEDGSGLHWSELDLDLGVPSLLQAVDPTRRADAEMKRLAGEDTGAALRAMREERRLRQRDIPGLSERQVRRLEKGRSRLTSAAAGHYAEAFDLTVGAFLERLGRHLGTTAAGARPT